MSKFLERNTRGTLTIDKSETSEGKIELAFVDDRFILDDFAYVVDIGFKDLPQAINAEDYVLRRYSDILEEARAKSDNSLENMDEVDKSATDAFYSDLANLINTNANSVAGANARVSQLQEEIGFKDQTIVSKDEQILSQMIEMEFKDQEIARKDTEIEQLRNSVQTIASATSQSLQKIEDLSMKQTEQLVNTINLIQNNS
jgi:hypothetical protein